MVTLWTLLLIVISPFLFAGEFVASVDRQTINMGEDFTLNLTLQNASANAPPSLDGLNQLFTIYSQQQLYNTVMTNGNVTSNLTWKIVLFPQQEGEFIFPSISINTTNGILTSEPIKIQVTKGVANSSTDNDMDVILTADLSNPHPYKNELINYTIRIVSKNDLADVKIQKLTLEDAIIELNGEARIFKKVIDGIQNNVIEIEYFIIPLKAGELKIPSTVIQGAIPIRNKSSRTSYPHEFNLFSMMQGYDQLKPFALATEELKLNIQSAIDGIVPWLPAKSLVIEELGNEPQSIHVREPFTRSFNIKAEGLKSTQLPGLNDQLMNNNAFKVYADKPHLNDENKAGIIKSSRKEDYTIIPQSVGSITLPELSVTWWDVVNKEKKVARIPSKTLQILPAAESGDKSHSELAMAENREPSHQVIESKKDVLLYGIISGLVLLLIAAFVWIITLLKRIGQPSQEIVELKEQEHVIPKKINDLEKYTRDSDSKYKPVKQSAEKDKKEKLPDLNPS